MNKVEATMDLQLFSGEKTEKATPKRRKEAREKGQVLRSVEINSAVSLLAMFGTIKLMLPGIIGKMQEIYKYFFTNTLLLDELYTYDGIQRIGLETGWELIKMVMPILAVALIVGVVINYSQVGFLFTNKTLAPKLSRMNPIEGFKKVFSKRVLFELLKSVIKLVIIGSVVYVELQGSLIGLSGLLRMDIWKGVYFIGDKAFTIAYKSALALLGLAVLDFIYQWWEYENSLKMSKQEIKDEYKQMEGDPQIRSRIRQKQRELGMRRMMQDIPKADVVITNPIHYAVALRYRQQEDDAPVVIAKGQDYVAIKIKEAAKEHDIIVMENKPLAQALYKTTDIGEAVPPELFHAVAEVLAFVYNLKGKTL